MELDELERHWQAFGEQDPLWAILSAPGKRGGAWELDEFLETGRTEVAAVLGQLTASGIEVPRSRALDFGCGVGRLTQALAAHFAVCDGVDLAASMIERAELINHLPERVRFHHNERPDLSCFENRSFDFVLSLLVLQHMEPALMRGYLAEFVRVLRPGGVAFFNIPARRVVAPPLPDGAWQGEISLVSGLPRLLTGTVTALQLRVRNLSPVAWPQEAQVRLGNHWRALDTTMLALDDGRADLPRLEPGEEQVVEVQVTAPRGPGEYILEFDLVQEWVSWFGDRGSPTLCLEVHATQDAVPVSPEQQEPGTPRTGFVPEMEMHVLGAEEVTAVVEAAGGRVLTALPGPHSLPEHPMMDYAITPARSGRGRIFRRLRRGSVSGA